MSVVTIADGKVESEKAPLQAFDSDAVVRSLLGGSRIEAMSQLPTRLVGVTDVHPLAQAAYLAFTQRYPLTLSPDVIWFCLARGLTLHVATDDELREQILQDDGDFELKA